MSRIFCLGLLACTGAPAPSGPAPSGPTYWRDVQPLLAESCLGCHREGDIAPFSLQTPEDAVAWAQPIREATESRSMPPWPPSDSCAPLADPRSLSPEQIATIGAWADAGAPLGDPADAVSVVEPAPFAGDLILPMTEPYTPQPRTDDYRCFVVDWPGTEPVYITAYQVEPGRKELVHHVILSSAAGAAAPQASTLDAGEAGPGYTCFGSSGVLGAQTVGGWVPGVRGVELPEGAGIRMEPGSKLIVQVHYNTLSTDAPGEDLTSVAFRVQDSVEHPMAALLMLDLAWLFPGQMAIPAGESSVVHETTFSGSDLAWAARAIDASPSAPITLHRVGLHMHLLGRSASLMVERPGEAPTCLLDIPDWDFHWQGSYNLAEPVVLQPEDVLHLSCEWDNSAPGAEMVDWGENTGDEMCLASLYVTQ
jgi:hypothetical protein